MNSVTSLPYQDPGCRADQHTELGETKFQISQASTAKPLSIYAIYSQKATDFSHISLGCPKSDKTQIAVSLGDEISKEVANR